MAETNFTCKTCKNKILKGIYKCTPTNYEMLDDEGNLVFIRMSNHEIPENDEEINTTLEMAYCPTCEVVLDIIHLMNEN